MRVFAIKYTGNMCSIMLSATENGFGMLSPNSVCVCFINFALLAQEKEWIQFTTVIVIQGSLSLVEQPI